MKTLIASVLGLLLVLLPVVSSAQSTEAAMSLTLSSTNPAAGSTVVVTLVVTNSDSIPHTFGTRLSASPTFSTATCHPTIGLLNGAQLATFQPGESHTYMTTLIAPAPSCLAANNWLVLASVQDWDATNKPTVSRGQIEFDVQ